MKAREKSNEIEALIKEMRKKYPEMEIIYTSSEKTKKNCGRPFEWAFITVDGFVTPCCRRVNPEVINFGNIFETSLKEIWYSKKAQDFRRSILEDLPNPICDECPD